MALCCLAVSVGVQAQRIRAYVSAGATASQIEGDELKGFDKWGFTGGVGAIASVSKSGSWLLGVEADYSRRGARNNSGNPYSGNFSLDYVDIPLTAYFHDRRGGMTVGAGLVYSRLVQQPHDELWLSSTFLPDTTDLTFLKNDLAAAVELRFTIWRGLQLSLRYQYSIIAIKKDWGFTEYYNQNGRYEHWSNDCYNSSAQIRLLWQF